MKALTTADYDALRKDIEANGITVPILVTDRNEVIDGHNRLAIAAELGLDPPKVPFDVKSGLGAAAKRAMAAGLNVHRRQLTSEQKRELIARELSVDSTRSDSAIAAKVGASDKTVAAVRRAKESTAEIPRLETRVSRDGKKHPAKAPKAAKPSSKKAEPRAENTSPAEKSRPGATGEEQTGHDPGVVPPRGEGRRCRGNPARGRGDRGDGPPRRRRPERPGGRSPRALVQGVGVHPVRPRGTGGQRRPRPPARRD